jgi:hypothetical protein
MRSKTIKPGGCPHSARSSSHHLICSDEFIKLELKRLRVAVLGVLDQQHHEEGDDRGPGIADELPGVRPLEDWATPHDDDGERQHESRRATSMAGGPVDELVETGAADASPSSSDWSAIMLLVRLRRQLVETGRRAASKIGRRNSAGPAQLIVEASLRRRLLTPLG